MFSGRTLTFLMLALLVGGIISLPSAMADDSDNPFSALWDAVFDLQSRDDDLQAQIDELRAEENAPAQTAGEPAFVSDLYAELDAETREDGRTLVHVTSGNSGQDRAAGVKLTVFYLMPLFEINSIEGDQCEDKSRGIIECVLGTLETEQESVITIEATARESGKANTWTVDISTTTDDADYSNNHISYDFETGLGGPIEIPQVEQSEQEEEIVEAETAQEPEPEQDNSGSNSTSTDIKESGANQTSSETVAQDSGSDSASEETEGDQSSESESSEGTSEDTQEEQLGDPAEGQAEEQGQEEQGASDGSAQDSSEENGSESSESSGDSQQESSEGGSESGASEENPSQ
jgi:hypothetical protein